MDYKAPNYRLYWSGTRCLIFIKFDNISVAEENIPRTFITITFGLLEFALMPFGLRNAAQTFRRFMDKLLGDMFFVQRYIDDMIMASPDLKSHEQHVKAVLKRLDENKINIH